MLAPLYALQTLAILFSLALIVFVIEAVRRTRLKERYALLWIGAGIALLLLSVYRPLLDRIALSLGVSYPPSLLFLVAFLFLLAIVLHYSLVLSSHRDSIRRLTQAVALLKRELEERVPRPSS
ncbi:MAG: DUF2304 domain-containing protein [Deltaproteobacteria bacterium]|nr:DUF2304 domain-containing protein [Deltaproteobacteria bacterium]